MGEREIRVIYLYKYGCSFLLISCTVEAAAMDDKC